MWNGQPVINMLGESEAEPWPNLENLRADITLVRAQITAEEVKEAVANFPKRCRKCIEKRGNAFEHEKKKK